MDINGKSRRKLDDSSIFFGLPWIAEQLGIVRKRQWDVGPVPSPRYKEIGVQIQQEEHARLGEVRVSQKKRHDFREKHIPESQHSNPKRTFFLHVFQNIFWSKNFRHVPLNGLLSGKTYRMVHGFSPFPNAP